LGINVRPASDRQARRAPDYGSIASTRTSFKVVGKDFLSSTRYLPFGEEIILR